MDGNPVDGTPEKDVSSSPSERSERSVVPSSPPRAPVAAARACARSVPETSRKNSRRLRACSSARRRAAGGRARHARRKSAAGTATTSVRFVAVAVTSCVGESDGPHRRSSPRVPPELSSEPNAPSSRRSSRSTIAVSPTNPPGPTTRTARDRAHVLSRDDVGRSRDRPASSRVIDASTRPSTTKNAVAASDPAAKSTSPSSKKNVLRALAARTAAAANASDAMEPAP